MYNGWRKQMNKQEAIKRVEQMGEFERFVDEPVSKKSVLDIISLIDETQKPVVPKFVAELINGMKQDNRPLYSVMSSLMNKINNEWTVWKGANMNFSEIVALAWIYGYEIEQEKLYTVEIPNPNSNAHTILLKTEKGIVLVAMANARWNNWEESKLTEYEIKQDFDFLWKFAKEVEEK